MGGANAAWKQKGHPGFGRNPSAWIMKKAWESMNRRPSKFFSQLKIRNFDQQVKHLFWWGVEARGACQPLYH